MPWARRDVKRFNAELPEQYWDQWVAVANSALQSCIDDGGAGELQVKTVAVPGAASYNVYNGEGLIGNVPNGAWQTIGGLSAGSYLVRTAGFDGVNVGILSFAIGVEVT